MFLVGAACSLLAACPILLSQVRSLRAFSAQAL
jgi:hypothetical protein